MPTTVEDWDVPDPAGLSLTETRTIRDEIEARVQYLVEHRLDEIRADRTAHQRRLASLLPTLAQEFATRHSETEIRQCSDAILSEYLDVPVRSYILPLALRRTRATSTSPCCPSGWVCTPRGSTSAYGPSPADPRLANRTAATIKTLSPA